MLGKRLVEFFWEFFWDIRDLEIRDLEFRDLKSRDLELPVSSFFSSFCEISGISRHLRGIVRGNILGLRFFDDDPNSPDDEKSERSRKNSRKTTRSGFPDHEISGHKFPKSEFSNHE